MDKLERYLMPIVIVVGILGLFLARAGEGAVVATARTIGIILAVFLASGFVIRWVMKYRGGKREYERLKREYEELLAEQRRLESEAEEKEPEGV